MNHYKKQLLFVFSFCIALIMMQSCWKDKSLRDKDFGDLQIDISPSFGIPLANLHFTGGDVVKQLNKSDSTNIFHLEYDPSQRDLCILVYDRANLQIVLPQVLPYDTAVAFSINYFTDLRIDGLTIKEVLMNLNIDNGYTEDITFNVKKIDYEDKNGNIKPITSSNLNNSNVIKAAPSDGKFTNTQLFPSYLVVSDPFDIIFNCTSLHFDFGLNYRPLQNISKINLNPILKIPAYFAIENLLRYDTVAANLKDAGVIFTDTAGVSLTNVTVYLTIHNGLPMEATLQVYFADENHQIIDSLQTKEMLIRSAEIDPTTFLLRNPTSAPFEISMSKERFKKIENAKYLIFKERFKSNNGRDVKIFKSNTFGVRLSIKADTKINSSMQDINDITND